MHVASIVIAIFLAVFFGFLGVSKVIGTKTVNALLAHVGVSPSLGRAIGGAECLAALGFFGAALWIKAAGIAAAIGVVLLMFGAVYYHLRAGDRNPKDLAPAIVIAILSVAVLGLLATA